MSAKLANNRISNVWRIISPKKSRQFSFQLIPQAPPAPALIIEGLNVVTIYFTFFYARACLDGKHHSSLRFGTFFFPHNQSISTILCKYSNYLWESKTDHGGRVRTHKTNETIIPFAIGLSWICIRITIYYYCYYCILFFLFILSDEPCKKKTHPNQQC